MHLYTSVVEEKEATMKTNVQLYGAVCIHHEGLLPLISTSKYQCAPGSKSTSHSTHRATPLTCNISEKIKIKHLSRILLKGQTCLQSSLLIYQNEFGPVYILMIIMDAAVIFSLRQQPKILIRCTSHSCLPSQISGETVHKPIELVSLKVTNELH